MHSGDFVPKHQEMNSFYEVKGLGTLKAWTLEEVEKGVHRAVASLKKMLKEQ